MYGQTALKIEENIAHTVHVCIRRKKLFQDICHFLMEITLEERFMNAIPLMWKSDWLFVALKSQLHVIEVDINSFCLSVSLDFLLSMYCANAYTVLTTLKFRKDKIRWKYCQKTVIYKWKMLLNLQFFLC